MSPFARREKASSAPWAIEQRKSASRSMVHMTSATSGSSSTKSMCTTTDPYDGRTGRYERSPICYMKMAEFQSAPSGELSKGCFRSEQRRAEAVLEERAVARRKDERRVFRGDLHLGEERPLMPPQRRAQSLDAGAVTDRLGDGEATGGRDRREVDAMRGVGFLHARLAVALIVEHGEGEVGRPLDADGGKAAHAHQHLAIAGDDENAAPRLRQCQAKPDHRRTPHGSPEREVERVIARRGDVPTRRTEPADHQKIAAFAKQRRHHGAAIERVDAIHWRPISGSSWRR